MAVFRRYYEQFISIPSIIDWSRMRPFDAEHLMEDYEDLPEFSDEEAKEILSHITVIKLNGGLGTTMGNLDIFIFSLFGVFRLFGSEIFNHCP